jgi:beta-glucosidase
VTDGEVTAVSTDRSSNDDDAAVAAQIEQLLAEMTLEEKAGQLTQFFYFAGLDQVADGPGAVGGQPEMVEAALARSQVGSLLFVRDVGEANRLQRLAIDGNRLHIPVLFGFDVIDGFRTILPVPIAMAASWDPEVIERAQAVAAREARAVGIHWTFAPMCDIAPDPRWGRIVEGAGEDPVLGAAVAAAQVRGFQGGRTVAPGHVIAGPKHFAAYGYAVGGRDYDEVDISDAQMWNVVLPPFRSAIDAGAGNVMTAYMDRNGIPATGDPWLFRHVLRDVWGFEGFVVSDAMAVHNLVTHGFAADLTDAAARALNAGCDMEMAIVDPAYSHLPAAVAAGTVRVDDLDESVRRVLRAKMALGLFDEPLTDEQAARQVLADPAHRDVARIAAERSIVLLRNEGALLPLDPSTIGRIAVIGPLADSRRDILGPWVFDHDLDETVTVLDGLRTRGSDHSTVEYAPGIRPARRRFRSMFDMFPGNTPPDPTDFDDDAELERAVDLATRSDVAVVVIGEWQHMIGESASRSSIELPGRQPELLQAVDATGTPTVALVMNGRPLDLRWAAEHVPAILDIWYPGTQGGTAVANIIFGDVSPAARLPFTWPRTVGQVPLVYNHTRSHDPAGQRRRYWDDDGSPLYPFGFGLSYSSFEYGPVTLDRDEISDDDTLTATVAITNTGPRRADEVAQLYVHQVHGTASRPVRELKAFRRVTIEPGATEHVTFTLGHEQLAYWNSPARDWVLDAAPYQLGIGGDSTTPLTTTFAVRY